jgi:NAD(P)-dependent dehydrogenase (short-subunit alcohol dehydrogenase family)
MFAQELEKLARVRVNSINPGRVRTAMRAAAYPGENPNTVPDPSTVADLFVYLLSPDSREIHDQYIEAQVQAPAA